MTRTIPTSDRQRARARLSARGFTIMEMMATLIVIGVLISLLLVAISGVVDSARGAADRQSLMGMRIAIDQFETEFGFLPPLVNDGPPLSPGLDDGPVDPNGRVVVRDAAFLTGRLPSGAEDPDIIVDNGDSGYSDKRYSKVSLPYYLSGASSADTPGGEPIDGVDGAGFRTPLQTGGFDPAGRRYGPLYDMESSRIARSYFNQLEFLEHGEPVLNNIQRNRPEVVAYIDRNGRAFRYYRWINSDPPADASELGEFMNVPRILLDPWKWSDMNASAASGSAEIAGARYAIIGAGRDGVFGTEPRDSLIAAFRRRGGIDEINDPPPLEYLRSIGIEDNVVEVGR